MPPSHQFYVLITKFFSIVVWPDPSPLMGQSPFLMASLKNLRY